MYKIFFPRWVRALCTPPRFLFTNTLVTISSHFFLTLRGIIIGTLVRIPGSCVYHLNLEFRKFLWVHQLQSVYHTLSTSAILSENTMSCDLLLILRPPAHPFSAILSYGWNWLKTHVVLPSRQFWDCRRWKSGLSIVIWDCGRWKSGPCLLGLL